MCVSNRMARRRTRKTRRKWKGGNVPTFHVLIVTSGRQSICTMLKSLASQLKENDAITLVFDGKFAKKKSTFTDVSLQKMNMKCKVNVKEQVPGLKHYGHPTINVTLPTLDPPTTYVMFADDDDFYSEGAFDALRNKCKDPDILYVAKMQNSGGLIPPEGTKAIEGGKIAKVNGIIPFKERASAKMGETGYAGDFEYYNVLKDKVKGVEFLDDIIYHATPLPDISDGNSE